MKRFKVLNALVLILVLGIGGISHSQEQNKTGETADDLFIRGLEYFDRKDKNAAIECFKKAVELDPSKRIYIEIMVYVVDRKFDGALKLLAERKDKFPGERELKVIQILNAETHFRWAYDLKSKHDYINAIEHLEAAYGIDIVYRRRKSAVDLHNIGFLYDALEQKQKALEYLEKALLIRREVGDLYGEASTLKKIGMIHDDLGQRQKSLEYYEKALLIFREVRDRSSEATILNNIGLVYHAIGQRQKALEYLEKALAVVCESGDRSGEATTLYNIGTVNSALGRKQKALEYFDRALPIFHEVGDLSGEASDLNNIGSVYDSLDQKQKALEYFEKALHILREVGNRSGETITLNNIGKVYIDLGQKQQALEYYENVLPILREIGDRSGEATTLNNIGGVYSNLGQKQKALEYFEKTLHILRDVRNRSGEATTLNNIGGVYSALGKNRKALENYEKALRILHEMGDRAGEATTLNNIGLVYHKHGQWQKALEYYEKVLPIYTNVGDRSGEATTLNNIGGIYYSLGQKQKALEYFEKALRIFHEMGDRAGEATALNNIGLVYHKHDQKQKALEYYERALPIYTSVEDLSGEATTLSNIRGVYYYLGQKQRELAIFYGKMAVNTLQNLRKNIDNLDIKTKLLYLQSEEDTYRFTAFLLILSRRFGEAQQVLDILKDEEYFSFVLKNRSAYVPQYDPIDYTIFELKWIEMQNTIFEKMSTISKPYHELLFKTNKTPEEKIKLGVLKRELEKAFGEYRDFLTRMKKEFETYKYKEDPDIDALTKQTCPIKEYLNVLDRDNNRKNVALHFLVYKGRISMIITTSTSQRVKHSPSFDDKEFNIMIYAYRNLIEKLAQLSRISDASSKAATKIDELSRQKRDIENRLYKIIFQPVHQYLKQYGAVNLFVSLDGVLRYIPLGSLFDGEHYLVQQYRIVRFNPSTLKHIDEKSVIKNKILGMGASKGGKGFKPLPHAGQEIRAIVHDREKGFKGLINGNALIDNDFTKETMINRLKTTSYPLVHIASHFKFSPGNETKNQLLLGDGTTMSLSDIRKEKDGKLFEGVKILVLSACQTGMGGNGEEIDGFGRLAQQCGAESVIASLWSVDDKSTKELMVKFYRLIKEGKVSSKIEALRLAQLELAGLEDLIGKSKAFTSAASAGKKDYSNPYYWASFILMGDWR